MATRTVRIANGVLASPVANEAVLLSIETGHYFGLNEVGARVWALLAQGLDLEAVAARLLEEYDVAETVVRSDLERLVDDLVRAGLVVEEEGGPDDG